MLIQKHRLQRGWSQEQLAEVSGLSVRTVQRLERGQVASVESLKAPGSAFEIDFSSLKEPTMDMPAGEKLRSDEALALAHVRKVKGFYSHLLQFLLIVSALAVLNIMVSPNYWWVGWVVLFWGLGVFVHGLQVFDKIPFLNGDWERREVEKYLGRKL